MSNINSHLRELNQEVKGLYDGNQEQERQIADVLQQSRSDLVRKSNIDGRSNMNKS